MWVYITVRSTGSVSCIVRVSRILKLPCTVESYLLLHWPSSWLWLASHTCLLVHAKSTSARWAATYLIWVCKPIIDCKVLQGACKEFFFFANVVLSTFINYRYYGSNFIQIIGIVLPTSYKPLKLWCKLLYIIEIMG